MKRRRHRTNPIVAGLALLHLLAVLLLSQATRAESPSGPLVQQNCTACHFASPDTGLLERIDAVRKTPERWEMTLERMRDVWGAPLSDDLIHALVKELSWTHGLAPAEIEPYRYILEGEPSAYESLDPADPGPYAALPGGSEGPFYATCSACHAFGDVALQRRTEAEWDQLPEFHRAINPLLPYRIPWDKVSEAIDELAATFPYDTPEWTQWQATRQPLKLSGGWTASGFMPGRGSYTATLTLEEGAAEDDYAATRRVLFDDGAQETWTGEVTLYGGHALRGDFSAGTSTIHAVLGWDPSAEMFEGRWFDVAHPDLAARETWRPEGPALLRVEPEAVPLGAGPVTVVLHGTRLPSVDRPADVRFADRGVWVRRVLSASPDRVELELDVSDARPGSTAVSVRRAGGEAPLKLFPTVDYIDIDPPGRAQARLGGTARPKIGVQFQAYAYWSGPDRVPGTADDLRLMPVQARWHLEEYDDEDAADDLAFVGTIDPSTGRFTPGEEGPNLARPYPKNNFGTVWVVATYRDPLGAVHEARRYLLVSTPYWTTILPQRR